MKIVFIATHLQVHLPDSRGLVASNEPLPARDVGPTVGLGATAGDGNENATACTVVSRTL